MERNGKPNTSLADNGAVFTDGTFERSCRAHKSKCIPALPNLLTATGMVKQAIEKLEKVHG